MSPDEFMRAYEAVLNAHDLEGTLALIADDAVFLFSNETSRVGKAAIAEAIGANFDAIVLETYRISGLRWLADSDAAAACVYEFHWAGEIGGQAASGSGRGTTVLRRAEGGWRIAHEHLSRGALQNDPSRKKRSFKETEIPAFAGMTPWYWAAGF